MDWNVAERNQQVKLMGKIYSSAAYTNIWLEPESHESSSLKDFVPQHANALLRAVERIGWTERDTELLRGTGTTVSYPEWIALKRFFDRPWFSRTWVVQEVVLSTEHHFICGEWSVSAHSLPNVARELHANCVVTISVVVSLWTSQSLSRVSTGLVSVLVRQSEPPSESDTTLSDTSPCPFFGLMFACSIGGLILKCPL